MPMRKVATAPDVFIASLPDDVRGTMIELDSIVTSCLPGRVRVLWEGPFWGGTDQRIIGYGDIVQPRPRSESVEWFLVGLARQQRAFSMYVNAVLDGAYLLARYADRLGTAKIGSASLSFTRIDDIDRDQLAAMLTQAHELTPPDGEAHG